MTGHINIEDIPHLCFPKSTRVLQALIDAKGGIVPFQKLIDAAWPGNRTVSPQNLRTAVNNIRVSIATTGWTVAVVRGTGYRLVRQ